MRKLWIALGFIYPTVDEALRTGKNCTRIGQDGYCVRDRAGFAEALSHHMSRDYATLSSDHEARTKIVERAKALDFPCVVWFSGNSFDALTVDDPLDEYPT